MKRSYSQCGEDVIADFLLNALGISSRSVRYLDIGCHHPKLLNNTFLFYSKGATGVCVDANPYHCAEFSNDRPNDIVLNSAMSIGLESSIPFWIMDSDTLLTTDKSVFEFYVNQGYKLKEFLEVPCCTAISLVDRFLGGVCPDLLSIDIEGADESVLSDFFASGIYPLVIIVETLEFVKSGIGRKRVEICKLMNSNGYKLYADTFINSIYVLSDSFEAKFNRS